MSKIILPFGAKYEANIHTHPDNSVFSLQDKDIANNLKVNAYLIGVDLELQRYNYSNNSTLPLGSISLSPFPGWLAGAAFILKSSWENHLVNGVCPKGFGCEYKTWPNLGR